MNYCLSAPSAVEDASQDALAPPVVEVIEEAVDEALVGQVPSADGDAQTEAIDEYVLLQSIERHKLISHGTP